MDVTIHKMPELRVGAVRHVGPYMQINRAFARLGEIVQTAGVEKTADMAMLAVPASGERIRSSPSYEIYRNTPENAEPHELRTDLYIPLE